MKSKSQIIQAFKEAVNMSSQDLQAWLQTDQSQQVGQKRANNQESIGHQSGKKIVGLLQKKEEEFSEQDFRDMQRVISYVHRHLAKPPASHIAESRWRYSLMNWGHDPLKK